MRISICAMPGRLHPVRRFASWRSFAMNNSVNFTMPVSASAGGKHQALWDEAQRLGVTVVEDLHCDTAQARLAQFIANLDVIYLTIDLDVLPVWEMPGVGPAALGVPLATLLRLD